MHTAASLSTSNSNRINTSTATSNANCQQRVDLTAGQIFDATAPYTPKHNRTIVAASNTAANCNSQTQSSKATSTYPTRTTINPKQQQQQPKKHQFIIKFHPFSLKSLPLERKTLFKHKKAATQSSKKLKVMSKRCCLSVSVVPSDKRNGKKNAKKNKNNNDGAGAKSGNKNNKNKSSNLNNDDYNDDDDESSLEDSYTKPSDMLIGKQSSKQPPRVKQHTSSKQQPQQQQLQTSSSTTTENVSRQQQANLSIVDSSQQQQQQQQSQQICHVATNSNMSTTLIETTATTSHTTTTITSAAATTEAPCLAADASVPSDLTVLNSGTTKMTTMTQGVCNASNNNVERVSTGRSDDTCVATVGANENAKIATENITNRNSCGGGSSSINSNSSSESHCSDSCCGSTNSELDLNTVCSDVQRHHHQQQQKLHKQKQSQSNEHMSQEIIDQVSHPFVGAAMSGSAKTNQRLHGLHVDESRMSQQSTCSTAILIPPPPNTINSRYKKFDKKRTPPVSHKCDENTNDNTKSYSYYDSSSDCSTVVVGKYNKSKAARTHRTCQTLSVSIGATATTASNSNSSCSSHQASKEREISRQHASANGCNEFNEFNERINQLRFIDDSASSTALTSPASSVCHFNVNSAAAARQRQDHHLTTPVQTTTARPRTIRKQEKQSPLECDYLYQRNNHNRFINKNSLVNN